VNRLFLSRSARLRVAALCFALALGLTGCGRNIFEQSWTTADVDTVQIYSLARPELNLPSGWDFVTRTPYQLKSTGVTSAWDVLLDTQDGQLVFLLPGSLGLTSETLVLPMPETAFDDVLRAPKDTTLYTRDMPIPVEAGTLYVVRTHQGRDRLGLSCVFYGKFQPLVVDPARGAVQFVYDVNVLCDDRALIPTDE
jgi:hypothetical protein